MTILEEAIQVTSSDRPSTYGHPLDHFTRTIGMLNARFAHKLKEPLDPEDWAVIMMLDKIARSAHSYSRDNLVDVAGYARTYEMVKEERAKRTEKF